MDPRPCSVHSLNSLLAPHQVSECMGAAVGEGQILLGGEGSKSTLPPRYKFPAKIKRGAGRTRRGGGDLFPPLPLRPEKEDGVIFLSCLFLHFLPPFFPFCFSFAGCIPFLTMSLWSFSISVLLALNLCVFQAPSPLLRNQRPLFPPAAAPLGF